VARRTAIRDLAFKHNAKPGLGFEILRLADLFARDARKELPEPLSVPQRPEFHTIYLGVRGRGTLVVDFTPVPIGAGRATIVARGRVEQFDSTNVDAWLLVFAPEFLALGVDPREADPLRGARVLLPSWAQPTIELATSDHRELLALADQLAAEQARPLDAIQAPLMSALLRAMLLRLERCVRADAALPPAELEGFFTILERDCQTTRNVAHYAKAAGISARRLGELLHAHAGRSTKQVIDERVVLEHKRLLVHTDISVKELAERTGFVEPTNLVKFFRHHTGTTPLEFRRNLPSARRS
jgi:AraC family transcriptional regulator, transcriptional activator of pobA